jgi:hypothetical protein
MLSVVATIFSGRVSNTDKQLFASFELLGQTVLNGGSRRSQTNGLFDKQSKQFTNRTQLELTLRRDTSFAATLFFMNIPYIEKTFCEAPNCKYNHQIIFG